MMRRAVCFGLWALGPGCMLPVARAQEARLSISADTVFVGERFELGVAVEHASGSTVAFQEVPDGDLEAGPLLSFGDAEVFSARRLPPRMVGAVRVDSVVYEAATFSLDNAVIGPIIIDLMADGDTSSIRSNRVALPVRSVVSGQESELRPPGPPFSFADPLGVWVLLGSGALIVLALMIWHWRRSRGTRKIAAPRLAPYPEASERLAALAIPEAETAIKPFYVELSDLLRTYLSRALGVPALELTTRELTDALALDERVPEAALKKIRGTLRVADLVKFADARPGAEAYPTSIEKAREAIELVEVVVHPPETELDEEQGSAGSSR